MKRSTAVALTRKAVRMIKGGHVAQMYPKVGVVISDSTIAFVTSHEHLWLGASTEDAKNRLDAAMKAVVDASKEYLKQAKSAGDMGMELVRNRTPGFSGLNATKYGGLVEAFYTWHYNHELDDEHQAAAAEIGKKAKLEVNPKMKWK